MNQNIDTKNDTDSSNNDSFINECAIDQVLQADEVKEAINSLNNSQYDPEKFLKNKIFSLEGIERRKDLFYLNLIHYDENLKNPENLNFYYKPTKLNVVGGYHGIDDFEIFKKYM